MDRTPTRHLFLVALMALAVLISAPATADIQDTDLDAHLYVNVMRAVGQTVASDVAREYGTDSHQHCIVTDALALCIHPDTPPERVEEIMRNLPTFDADKYGLGTRWTVTAIDGSVAGNAPVNLTYSFVPDGVMIPGSGGEPDGANRIYAEMNYHFGDESVWKPMFAQMFNDWGAHVGITYQEVDDDGASFPGSPGELGLRGDVRIACHYIDGMNGTLAYDFFPNVSDMVLDSQENWSASSYEYRFMRNIIRHEHGHGIGLQHTLPENGTKLMEAYINLGFDGPQDDDIRGGMRHYGDSYELNSTISNATDLGTLDGTFSFANPVSITTGIDYDYFRFYVAGPSELDVTIDPYGFRYELDGVMVDTDEIMDLAFRVLGGVNGSEVLAQVNDVGLGDNEVLVDFTLPEAGEYWVLVYRAGGTSDVQRYQMVLDVEPTGVMAAGDRVPTTDLGLGVYPNPFNPRTTARFYVAEAGPVSMDVYDVSGRLVRTVRGEVGTVGWSQLVWDGLDNGGASAPSGTYLMQVRAGGRVQTARGVLVE